MSYYAFEGLIPVVHPDAFVHPSAVLIGDVIVGAGVYIGHSRHCVGIMVA
ncbi:carnitine operon protein CaiE [Salmonella enterica subsp. enterica serovar Braenderup]|nr:carnitine operon protein CaiE [Salmonella enterica subsp. enterica serovar Braenderup]